MTHTYLNKGKKRKKQIYNWFIEVVSDRVNLDKKFKQSIRFLFENKKKESLKVFDSLLREVLSKNPDNIGVVLEYDITIFGYGTVFADLYKGTVSRRIIPKLRPKLSKKQLKSVNIKDFIESKKIKKKPEKVFGIAPDNKRKKANLESIFFKKQKRTQLVLRDPETGRFLKQTKTLRNKIKNVKE